MTAVEGPVSEEIVGDVLTMTREVSAEPGHVWRCLTDPHCFKVWWQEHLEFEAQDGGRFAAPWKDPEGEGRRVKAQVTAFHPPHGLVMVWADEAWTFDTVVAITIEPAGEGSRVTIEHQGWTAAPEADRSLLMRSHHDDWTRHLQNWALFAEDFEARPKGH